MKLELKLCSSSKKFGPSDLVSHIQEKHKDLLMHGVVMYLNSVFEDAFCAIETEYLGYILTRTGIKPQLKKVQAILAITPPKQVKDLRKFLGMVQYY